MFKHRSILITLFFLCGATGWSAAETTGTDPLKVISRDSTFYYASLVNDYFMRTYPTPRPIPMWEERNATAASGRAESITRG